MKPDEDIITNPHEDRGIPPVTCLCFLIGGAIGWVVIGFIVVRVWCATFDPLPPT